jgi:hypothetical protein
LAERPRSNRRVNAMRFEPDFTEIGAEGDVIDGLGEV